MDNYEKICRLKKEKDVVILAHYYVDGAVQEAADFVGDSYALAKRAAEVSQQNILFAGVSFMGESAKLLNPDKHVYMVDPCAGCKMPEKQIYFVPDAHLAQFVAQEVPEKDFIFHDGYCPTHQKLRKEDVLRAKQEHPKALMLSHPECKQEVLALSDFVGSTADIIRFAGEHAAEEYLIATETGVFYELQKENSNRHFYPVTAEQVCPDMKRVTLEKTLSVLEHLEEQEEIVISNALMEQAKLPLERMLALAK